METRRRVVRLSCTWFGPAPAHYQRLTLQAWRCRPETLRRMAAVYPPARNGVQLCWN